jgi:hypothetical protein
LATFTQAISSTNPTAASRASISRSASLRSYSPRGMSATLVPPSSSAYCWAIRPWIVPRSACARSRLTPGARRAMATKLFESRPWSPAVNPAGTQTCRGPLQNWNWNSGGITPTTVYSSASIRIVLPTSDGSAP